MSGKQVWRGAAELAELKTGPVRLGRFFLGTSRFSHSIGPNIYAALEGNDAIERLYPWPDEHMLPRIRAGVQPKTIRHLQLWQLLD